MHPKFGGSLEPRRFASFNMQKFKFQMQLTSYQFYRQFDANQLTRCSHVISFKVGSF